MNDIHHTPEVTEDKDGGFTLVELLIVIVILGILAAATVFAVGGITSTAETNVCDLEARTLRTAQEAYFAESGVADAPAATLVAEGYLTAEPSPQCAGGGGQ